VPGTRNFSTPGCTVTVCRDCCCGNSRKHPRIDHDGQLVRLRESVPAPHRVRVSECLDACAEANVIVVHPEPEARRRGARAVWFGLVADDAVEEDITAWVRAGGPGVAPMPAILELSVLRR
jgi:(2Fe-2S) ferredoxin